MRLFAIPLIAVCLFSDSARAQTPVAADDLGTLSSDLYIIRSETLYRTDPKTLSQRLLASALLGLQFS